MPISQLSPKLNQSTGNEHLLGSALRQRKIDKRKKSLFQPGTFAKQKAPPWKRKGSNDCLPYEKEVMVVGSPRIVLHDPKVEARRSPSNPIFGAIGDGNPGNKMLKHFAIRGFSETRI
jgi:hypothetical protein